MATYKKDDGSMAKLAAGIICETPQHLPLADARVRIDYLLAYPEYDEVSGEAKGPAMKTRGHAILGKCRISNLKERTQGLGDAEIILDGLTWENASELERRGLLDHELTHLGVKSGVVDDMGRPKLKMRHHDFETGWFAAVAARNGEHSPERIQAKRIMDSAGQYFWPALVA